MTLQDLIAKRQQAAKRKSEIADAVVAADRDLSEDEQTEFDALDETVQKLTRQIEIKQRVEDDAEFNVDSPKPKTQRETPRIENVRNLLADDPTGGYCEVAAVERAARNNTPIDTKIAERGFGQFAADIRNSRAIPTERLAKWRQASYAAADGMATNIGSDGGYLIPQAFGALIEKIGLEAQVIRPRAFKVPMTTQEISFPWLDDTSHSSTVFGGVQAYFTAEEAAITASKPKLSSITLRVHKLAVLCPLSNEMADWSPFSIGPWLINKMGLALGWKEDQKFIAGTGAGGEPTGLLNSACIISVAKEALQAAATFVFENAIKMAARLWDSGNLTNCVWLMNKTVWTQLPLLNIVAGTAGTPIFLPGNDAANRPGGTLLGMPIVFTEHCKALGTTGDIFLANLNEYLVGDASGKTRTDRDMYMYFNYDQQQYRLVTYTGGCCPWRVAFTPENGDTLSPIIKLDART